MGCGESKHAVTTADTISQSKRSNSKKSKDVEAAAVKATNDVVTNTNAAVKSQENVNKSGEPKDSANAKGPEDDTAKENVKAKDEKEANVKSNDNANGAASEENVKEIENVKAIEENVQAETLQVEDKKIADENKETKGENPNQVTRDVAPVTPPISDPQARDTAPVQEEESQNFFSPNKDGETIESIISEGLSGKSEYHSPLPTKGLPEESTKGNEAVNANDSPEETKIQAKNGTEEAVNVNEVKPETVSPAEGKDSGSTEEEKAPPAKEETVAEASTEDSKTN